MSRVGKKPIKIPSGVKISITGGTLEVESKKAKLSSPIPPGIHFKIEGDELLATRDSDEKPYPAYHGMARALAANNVRGVTEGFTKMLDIVGIGFKADAKAEGRNLQPGIFASDRISHCRRASPSRRKSSRGRSRTMSQP